MVLNEENRIVYVIASLPSKGFTKCIRVDSTVSIPTNIEEEPNGYKCAEKFFGDIMVQESLNLAKEKLADRSQIFKPYPGTLYSKELGYLMWPILNRKKLTKNKAG